MAVLARRRCELERRGYSILINDGNNAVTSTPTALVAVNSNALTGTITITPVNDVPVVDLNGGTIGDGVTNSVTWTEGSNTAHVAITIAPSATITDVDNLNLTQMQLVVVGVLNGDSEVLKIAGTDFQLGHDVTAVHAGSYSISYVASTGTFTIVLYSGTIDTRTNFQSLLRGITYINNTDNPTDGDRTVTVTVTDAGHSDTSTVAGEQTSVGVVATINVNPVNDQPVITGLDAVSYFENAINVTAAVIDSAITVTDIDSANYDTGSLTVSGITTYDTVSLPATAATGAGNITWTGVNGGNVSYNDTGSNWIVVGTATGGAGASFIITFNASATPAIAERVIENLTFANSSNNPQTNRTLTFALNDGDGQTVQNATVVVTIKYDNDAPTMTSTSLGGTYTEQNATALQFVGGTIAVGDPDANTDLYTGGAGSLTVSLDTYVTGDTLSVLTDSALAGHVSVSSGTISYGGVAFATVDGTNNGAGKSMVINFTSTTATPAAVQALLAQLRYSNIASDDPTVNNTDPSRAFTVTLNDGGNTKDATSSTTALTATLTGTITVTAVNDAPVVTTTGSAQAYTENGTAVIVDSGISLSDLDDTDINRATVQITVNLKAGDVLAVGLNTGSGKFILGDNTTQTNISASYSNGLLTLSGVDTKANYQAVLQAVTYVNTDNNPNANNATNPLPRTVTFTVVDNNSDVVGEQSGFNTRTVNVTAVNDAPIIAGTLSNPTAVEAVGETTGTSTVTLLSGATVTDADFFTASTNFNLGYIVVGLTTSGGTYTTGDVLSIQSGSGPGAVQRNVNDFNYTSNGTDWITIGTVSGSNGVGTALIIQLNDHADQTNVAALLNALSYRSTSDNPTVDNTRTTRTYSISLEDGNNNDLAGGAIGTSAASNILSGTITITPVNDAPTATITSATYAATEQTTLTLHGTGLSIADVDAASATVTATLSVTTDTYGGVLAVAAGSTGVTVSNSGTQSVTLSGSVAQINALLAGSSSGTVTYTANNDRPIASTTLTLSVNDGGNTGGTEKTASDTAVITVTPVNDAPTVTLPASITGTSENVFKVISGISIADPDAGAAAEAATTTLTLSVTHGTLTFTDTTSVTASGNGTATVVLTGLVADINARLGSNNFVYTSDTNFSGIETLTTTVNDHGNVGGGDLTATASMTFTVSGINNPPVLTAPVTLAVAEDSTLTLAGTFTITDPDIVDYVMQADVSVNHGTLTFSSMTGLTLVDSTTNGTASVHVQGTRAAIDAALDLLKYTPTANYHGSDLLTTTVHDRGNVSPNTAQGLVSGSAADNTDTRTTTITVTSVNDQPTATIDTAVSIAVTEDLTNTGATFLSLLGSRYSDTTDNQTANSGGNTETALTYVAITHNYAVVGQGTWEFSLNSGSTWIAIPPTTTTVLSDTAAILISANAQLHFVPAANFQGTPGSLTVRVADNSQTLTTSTTAADLKNLGSLTTTGSWAANALTLTAAVTGVNDAPTISGSGAQTLAAVVEDVLTGANSGNDVATLFGGRFSDQTDNQANGTSPGATVSGGTSTVSSFGGVAIVGNTASAAQGTWEYSINAGSTWTAVSTSVSDSTAVLLSTTDKLRFTPATNFNGTPGVLTARLSDATVVASASSDLSGLVGGTQHWSVGTVALNTSITAVNDAPAGTNNTVTATEDTSYVFSAADFGFTDPIVRVPR